MKITAPFTPAQVQVLNERQVHVDGSMPIHPFTCPNRGDGITFDSSCTADTSRATHGNEGGDRGVLIATEDGWVCPHCGYRQDWAFAEMAELPIPLGEMFKDFPTIAEIYGVVRPEALDQLIAQYRELSAQGKPGAEVMRFCLERRRMAQVGDSRPQDAGGVGMMRGAEVDDAIKGSRQDPFYREAREVVLAARRSSISMVQRHLRIGYNHAARLLEAMEGDILGPMDGNGVRPFLATASAPSLCG